MEITVARGLVQLKRLDDRIKKSIKNINDFVVANKKRETSVLNGTYTRDTFSKKVKSEWQSLNDLLELRREIKSAIVLSNANTKVWIAGREYTVADAIERKNSIHSYETSIIRNITHAYNNAMFNVNDKNLNVEDNAHNLFGKPSENKKDEVNRLEMIKAYIDLNSWEIVDPLNLKDLKDSFSKEVEDFLSEVDSVLTESNATTKITISKNPINI